MDKPRKDNQGIVLPFPFIFTLRFLEFINSYLGMRLAAFFFAKPFKYKIPQREIPVLSAAKKSSIYINSIDKNVCLYQWSGKGPKIMLLHGWSGRASNFFKIIEELIIEDYDVYAFDAPAHGESSGVTTNLPEFIHSLQNLIDKRGPFEAIVGHSGGGFASIYVVAHNPTIKKLILISPFDKVIDVFEKYFDLIQLGVKARKLMVQYFNHKTGKKIEELSSSILAQSIVGRSLVIHDKNDREVSFSDGVNIDKNLNNSSLFVTKGLGHRRILRDEEVINHLVNFMKIN
tara:strand:+ start:644 stop:1507 length:864 start_codon:yes stop_codon:yes gene_type:complete